MQTFSQITAVADSSFTGALYCKDPILVIFNNFIPVEMSQQFMSTSLYNKKNVVLSNSSPYLAANWLLFTNFKFGPMFFLY